MKNDSSYVESLVFIAARAILNNVTSIEINKYNIK